MTIKQIFEELEQRHKSLDKNISAKIEGNSKENEYVYSKEDREQMQKELSVVENTMAFLDNEMYVNKI